MRLLGCKVELYAEKEFVACGAKPDVIFDMARDRATLERLKSLEDEGELVVNKDIADDVLEIFKELYESGYQIEKVRLVDEYDADDEASMSDNNSSAFNFRFISHTTKISKHGMGMAVDINTLYNPYVKTVDGELSIEPANAADYVDRSKDFSHKIDHDDLCYKLFTEHGFEWGGDWTHSKDYQHFEK